MNLYQLGSLLFNSRFGKFVLSVTARLLYIDAVRKPLLHAVSQLVAKSILNNANGRAGCEKIHAQYRDISLAALHSMDRAIGKKILAPRVASLILELWGRALFPSGSRSAALRNFRAIHGAAPPWFLVISPTRACNLQCTGCYANAEPGTTSAGTGSLPWEMLDRIMTEARRLWGVPLFVFSGGEPLAFRSQGKDLLDIVEKHRDCLFLMFTNGTMINKEIAQRLAKLGNLTPCLSVEGLREQTDQRRGAGVFVQVMEAMAHLREAGVPFGVSMTATRANCEKLLSDQLLDYHFSEQGAFYAFIFQYMPIGRVPDLDWMPAPTQRIPFWKRSWEVVRQKRLFLLDFWNHGPLVEGCIAAGRERGYLHIDWNGDVMPCVFVPYVAANLHDIYKQDGNLNDVWATPFFRQVRQWQREYGYGSPRLSEDGNWMLPCPFRDHFAVFRDWIGSLNPKPQEGVAPIGMMDEPFCARMLAYGSEQARSVQELWEKEYLA